MTLVRRVSFSPQGGFVAGLQLTVLTAPDHTTLTRRSSTVVVPSLVRMQNGPIHLVIDSTGLKMLGPINEYAGEWHAHRRPDTGTSDTATVGGRLQPIKHVCQAFQRAAGREIKCNVKGTDPNDPPAPADPKWSPRTGRLRRA